MKYGVFLAGIFLFSILCQYSLIHVLRGPWASIPLLTIVGIVVFQRVGMEEGMAWFAVASFFHGFNLYAFFWVCIGPLLLQKIFTTRSWYALLGLGVFGHIVVSVTFVVLAVLWNNFSPLVISPLGYAALFGKELLLLILGLLLAMIFLRFVERRLFMRIPFRLP